MSTSPSANAAAAFERTALSGHAAFNVASVQLTLTEARARCLLVAPGLDKLTASEQLALRLLCGSAQLKRSGALARADLRAC